MQTAASDELKRERLANLRPRPRVRGLAVLIFTALAIAAAQSREAPFGYATEQSVREACGENLRSKTEPLDARWFRMANCATIAVTTTPKMAMLDAECCFAERLPSRGPGPGDYPRTDEGRMETPSFGDHHPS